ncbi:hypothetical protein [Niallia oryzisoli]|uniref:hypothetical protein n=1 Tax=Niallia oryzisoli TaxID=1737571 RepID=UPI00373522EB
MNYQSLERVKSLIGEENYSLLLKNGFFPIEIDAFKKLVVSKYKNNHNQSSKCNDFIH